MKPIPFILLPPPEVPDIVFLDGTYAYPDGQSKRRKRREQERKTQRQSTTHD